MEKHEFKATDFRSGNLIMHKGEIWEINDIHGASGLISVYPKGTESLGRRSMHDFSPIPITEKLISRASPIILDSENEQYEVFYNVDDNHVYSTDIFALCDRLSWRKLMYWHELQNFLFELSRYELTWNKKDN